MKGLLLKDIYMLRYYCRSYLLIAAVFLAISLVGDENTIFLFYPCLLCGMIPVTLLSYDERSGFLKYSAALPYTKSQIVSSKYLLGGAAGAAILLVTGLSQGIKTAVDGTFAPAELGVMLLTILLISLLASAIPLPFIFRYGMEKGRMAYYVMLGFVCAAGVLASDWRETILSGRTSSKFLFIAFSAAVLGIYILSWRLSVKFFKKREL